RVCATHVGARSLAPRVTLIEHHTFEPFFSLIIPLPPRSPLFPYTTLFRSRQRSIPRSGDRPRVLWGEPRLVAPLETEPYRELYRSEEHTSELQSLAYLVCRLLLEKKKDQEKVTGWAASALLRVSLVSMTVR